MVGSEQQDSRGGVAREEVGGGAIRDWAEGSALMQVWWVSSCPCSRKVVEAMVRSATMGTA